MTDLPLRPGAYAFVYPIITKVSLRLLFTLLQTFQIGGEYLLNRVKHYYCTNILCVYWFIRQTLSVVIVTSSHKVLPLMYKQRCEFE